SARAVESTLRASVRRHRSNLARRVGRLLTWQSHADPLARTPSRGRPTQLLPKLGMDRDRLDRISALSVPLSPSTRERLRAERKGPPTSGSPRKYPGSF